MVQTGEGNNNIFRQVEKINIADMHIKVFGYFVLQVIINVKQVLTNRLVVSDLQNLSNTLQEVQNFYGRVHSYMIANEIESSITNTSLNKLRLHIR